VLTNPFSSTAKAPVLALTTALALFCAIPARSATPIYAGGVHGVYASMDGGVTWTQLLSGVIVESLAIDPQDPQIIYAGADNSIYKTNDGGGHWKQLTKGLEKAAVVTSIQINPTSPNILYAGTGIFGTGVYESHNNGNKWDPVNNGLTSNCGGCLFVTGLAIDPLHPSTLYVTGNTGFISSKTTNGGASWTSVDFPGNFGNAVAVNPVQTQNVFMGGPFGLWKSTSGGAPGTWTPSGPFNLGNPVQTIAIDPSNPSTVYVGNGGCSVPSTTCYNEVYVSSDNGVNWTGVGALLPPSPSAEVVRALIVDPGNSSTLYAGGNNGVYQSLTGGTLWTLVTPSGTGAITALAMP
jgi:hypothetical protein